MFADVEFMMCWAEAVAGCADGSLTWCRSLSFPWERRGEAQSVSAFCGLMSQFSWHFSLDSFLNIWQPESMLIGTSG